ncbi:UNVERIFIED_CONTAM: hypothetical protein GTU68_010017 [Idotea baltica]|nr:hypothetical protein [Idotea baltica]
MWCRCVRSLATWRSSLKLLVRQSAICQNILRLIRNPCRLLWSAFLNCRTCLTRSKWSRHRSWNIIPPKRPELFEFSEKPRHSGAAFSIWRSPRMPNQPSIQSVRDALVAQPGAAFNLASRDTSGKEVFEDKAEAKTSLKDDAVIINELKDKLYATGEQALLVVLQGMDTAGKSGTLKNVFAKTSPLGMQVKAFKAPSKNELARDYLWRIHNAIPKKGTIGIFDRSHYEDVLVARVRGFASPEAIEQRYAQINDFERHMTENGVTIVKCMLNVSHEEQGIRLAERLVEPHKLWKFNPGDLEDRKLWPEFMDAYEIAVSRCSTLHAPWHVIPADSRTRRNACVARLVRGALEDMDLSYPNPSHKPEDFKI